MSIGNNIIKEIEKKSIPFCGMAELYEFKELSSDFKLWYIISPKIKNLLGETVKIDRKLIITDFLNSSETDFLKDYPDDRYTYKVKNDNIWISGYFIKQIIDVDKIIPDELFEL